MPEPKPFIEDIFERAIDEDGVLGDVLIESKDAPSKVGDEDEEE